MKKKMNKKKMMNMKTKRCTYTAKKIRKMIFRCLSLNKYKKNKLKRSIKSGKNCRWGRLRNSINITNFKNTENSNAEQNFYME